MNKRQYLAGYMHKTASIGDITPEQWAAGAGALVGGTGGAVLANRAVKDNKSELMKVLATIGGGGAGAVAGGGAGYGLAMALKDKANGKPAATDDKGMSKAPYSNVAGVPTETADGSGGALPADGTENAGEIDMLNELIKNKAPTAVPGETDVPTDVSNAPFTGVAGEVEEEGASASKGSRADILNATLSNPGNKISNAAVGGKSGKAPAAVAAPQTKGDQMNLIYQILQNAGRGVPDGV